MHQCGDHKEKNVVRNVISAKKPEEMGLNRFNMRAVARLYPERFKRFLAPLEGDCELRPAAPLSVSRPCHGQQRRTGALIIGCLATTCGCSRSRPTALGA